MPSVGAPGTGVMTVGSLTGASSTVATSASLPASTQATSSLAPLKATTPLLLPASWVGDGI